ncbi:MAG: methyltransferase domain-containing protein [Pseudomonadota bacterium]
MQDGWNESATAWIASLGEHGDFARRFVLDQPMLERVRAGQFSKALDVGCGEGRFCRQLAALGIDTRGIDPTEALIASARKAHPSGTYQVGKAEHLDFPDHSFDLVVSYLTFIDIPDIARGISEMCRVLRPGGALLIANLNGFQTAAAPGGWRFLLNGRRSFTMDHYMQERADWVGWKGIKVQNWHRPMSAYFKLLRDQGLQLSYFDEPLPSGGDPARVARFKRVPYFHIMEWRKK